MRPMIPNVKSHATNHQISRLCSGFIPTGFFRQLSLNPGQAILTVHDILWQLLQEIRLRPIRNPQDSYLDASAETVEIGTCGLW